MTYNQALEFIHSRPRLKKTDNHAAMGLLLQKLNNPQDKLKYIHIAGTNGKGSCAKMLSNILQESGYKTGLNISPFVIDFTERFSVNGKYIPKETLAQITEKIEKFTKEIEVEKGYILVEFEIVTAIAFCYFAMEKCDVVCLEVGLGGLKDSTNIIADSLVSCIMNISFDHTEILGETIEEIALQKAGIIKENQKVICYPAMDKAALKVIEAQAKEKHSAIIVPSINNIQYMNNGFLKSRLQYKNFSVNQSFAGEHQGYNTAVVIEAALALIEKGFNINDKNIVDGIEKTTFPARIEVVSRNPLIILDGAHNLDGINALAKVLKENNLYNLTAVWASLSDKQPQEIIKTISPFLDSVYIVDLHGARAVKKEDLASMAKEYITNCQCCDTVKQAIELVKANNQKGMLVFGSLYLASEARQFLI